MRISRRGVQVVLGLLWLLDGALQLQRQMFTDSFVQNVVTPATQGQPRIVSGPMNFGAHLFLLHPAIFNGLFALTQLAIGALILRRRSVKLGLMFSVAWAVVVWVFGEGYGGIFSAHTLLLMGAPGAVSLYAILALAVMPRKNEAQSQDPKKSQPDNWLVAVWLVLWSGGALYQLLPGQDSVTALSSMLYANSVGTPGWLYSIDTHLAGYIGNLGPKADTLSGMHMSVVQMVGMNMSSSAQFQTPVNSAGYWFILLLAGLQLFIGVAVIFNKYWRRLAIALGIILALCFWVVGQSLGGFYTGVMTDPNSGPLFILLGICLLSSTDLDQPIHMFWQRLDKSFD